MDRVKETCNIQCTNCKPGPIFFPFKESADAQPQPASESEGDQVHGKTLHSSRWSAPRDKRKGVTSVMVPGKGNTDRVNGGSPV